MSNDTTYALLNRLHTEINSLKLELLNVNNKLAEHEGIMSYHTNFVASTTELITECLARTSRLTDKPTEPIDLYADLNEPLACEVPKQLDDIEIRLVRMDKIQSGRYTTENDYTHDCRFGSTCKRKAECTYLHYQGELEERNNVMRRRAERLAKYNPRHNPY